MFKPSSASGYLDALWKHAAERGTEAALLAPGRAPLTFSELCAELDSVAAALTAVGVVRGGVVASVLPDGVGTICCLLGVMRVAALAPLNPALSQAELEFYLSDLGASVVLVEQDTDTDTPAVRAARALKIPLMFAGNVEGCVRRAAVEAVEAVDTTLLLYTSATTGRPKLVGFNQAQLGAMATITIRALALRHTDRFLMIMPHYHLQGLNSAVAQLIAGGSVVCPAGFEAGAFPMWLDQLRPTWYTAGPALQRAALAALRDRDWRPGSAPLRFVRSIGAALPQTLLNELEGTLVVPVVEGYGLTEAGTVTSNPLPPGPRKPGSAGVAVGPQVSIVDEAGTPVAAGSDGEIVLRGESVATSYQHDQEATRAAFRNGWFRTGDLGRFDSEGYLFVTGRLKEMINRGGEKVLPNEIDEVLQSHPAVQDAAAFGIPHPALGEDVAAAVVVRANATVTVAELRHFAASILAAYKVPRRIELVDAIPKSATGKPQRNVLAEQVQNAWGRAPAVVAATDVERDLVAIWSRVLRTSPIWRDDDFFRLGGDSFAVTLMLVEVQAAFGELADVAAFLDEPTVARLARLILEQGPGQVRPSAAPSPVLILQREGPRAPLFCIPGMGNDPYYFRHLAKHLGKTRPFLVLRDQRPDGAHSVEEVAAKLAVTIQATQPKGPYHLGGHCYGGVVAFELARQLEASGESVAVLALFDTPTPGYPKVVRQWKRYLTHARAMVLNSGPTLREALAHGRDLLRRQGRLAAVQLGVEPVPAADAVVAFRTYEPGPFSGSVTVFLANDELHSTRILDDSRLGWKDFARGGFEVRRVVGMHDTMFAEPHVQSLAGELRTLLAKLD